MADKLPHHQLPVLASVRVAAPCKASWSEMAGDARSRFCGECKTQVFNLSEMTREQAERLIIERNGDLCARYYQRADGTVMTSDCEEGVHRRKRTAVAAYAGLAALFVGGGAIGAHEVAATGPAAEQLDNLDLHGDADGVRIENTDVTTEHYDVDSTIEDLRDKVRHIDESLVMGRISTFDRTETLKKLEAQKEMIEKLKLEAVPLDPQIHNGK